MLFWIPKCKDMPLIASMQRHHQLRGIHSATVNSLLSTQHSWFNTSNSAKEIYVRAWRGDSHMKSFDRNSHSYLQIYLVGYQKILKLGARFCRHQTIVDVNMWLYYCWYWKSDLLIWYPNKYASAIWWFFLDCRHSFQCQCSISFPCETWQSTANCPPHSNPSCSGARAMDISNKQNSCPPRTMNPPHTFLSLSLGKMRFEKNRLRIRSRSLLGMSWCVKKASQSVTATSKSTDDSCIWVPAGLAPYFCHRCSSPISQKTTDCTNSIMILRISGAVRACSLRLTAYATSLDRPSMCWKTDRTSAMGDFFQQCKSVFCAQNRWE